MLGGKITNNFDCFWKIQKKLIFRNLNEYELLCIKVKNSKWCFESNNILHI